MDYSTTKIIACKTVIKELGPLLPEAMGREVFDFGRHNQPEILNKKLQERIDRSTKVKTIVLGYGLCSQAVIGLKATTGRLVIPKVDDCIGLVMGSTQKYRQQVRKDPGTYYLTRAWIAACDSPFEEHARLEKQYGPEKAGQITATLLKNYHSLAFVDTGHDKQKDIDQCRAYVQKTARQFDLQYKEIKGATALLQKMVRGPWDDDFIVIDAGEVVTYAHFKDLR